MVLGGVRWIEHFYYRWFGMVGGWGVGGWEGVDLSCFQFHAAVFIYFKSLFAAHFKLCKLSFVLSVCLCVVVVMVCVCLCVCVCVCV